MLINKYLSECASASTAAPSVIAGSLLRLLSRRWMEYAACDFAFGKVLCISLLLVLCKFFAFLVSCLLVLWKFSASFLRSFLRSLCRSSARAAENVGKLNQKCHRNQSKMERIWPRASARGTRKSTEIWKNRKNANANTKMRKKNVFLYVRRFPEKTEGSTARRLPMFFAKKVIKMLYKTEHNETQQKQKIWQIHRKNDLLKDTMFQRHKDYYGFVKTRSFHARLPRDGFLSLRTRIGSILAPFCDRGKTEKEPKSDQMLREEHFAPSKNGHWSGFGKQSKMHWGICDIYTFGKGETMLKCGRGTKFKVFMVLA